MTDCSSLQGSTSSSSDAMSSRSGGGGSSGVNSSSRIRIVRMLRPSSRRIILGPENNIGFGFAIRGGKEFGTGFFVSRVEKGSEADIKGMRLGDQIIRVNGYHVEDAVHKEVTQFISSQDRLTLKVRGVGMLPIKEKIIDPLTWHIVPRHVLKTALTVSEEHMTIKDVRIVLKVAPKTKLGLGICKGPEWKPGIFVQFTKDFSVARDSGLRPGDQILSCNSIDFSDVLFSEAVAVMKSSQTLEMLVRTAAGLDLFPGESSGYNSSASSITGDQSPCWGDQSSKRLSMVREEQHHQQIQQQPSKQWLENKNNLDRRKNVHNNIISKSTTSNSLNANSSNDTINNKTIIQLSESGTLINNTLITNPNSGNNKMSENLIVRPNHQHHHHHHSSSTNYVTPNFQAATAANEINGGNEPNENNFGKTNGKIADICFVSRQSEIKTVIVEVHRSAAEENSNNNDAVIRRSSNDGLTQMPPKPPMLPTLVKSATTSSSPSPSSSVTDSFHDRSSSVASSITSSGGTSLCSAISEELKKRQERLSQGSNQTNNETLTNSKAQTKRGCVPVLGGNDDEERHNALMNEFKRAHRKMFKNGFTECEKERQEELRKTSMMRDETDHRSPPPQQQQQQLQQQANLPLNTNVNNHNHSNGHQNGIIKSSEFVQNNHYNNNFTNNNNNLNGQFPTPPPPPQFANKPLVVNKVYNNEFNRNTTSQINSTIPPPPQTPIPDYDSTPMNSLSKQQNYHANGCIRAAAAAAAANGTIGRVASTEMAKANGDAAELESIDSYKLQNPSSPQPKPPAAYFVAQSSGPPTMKKTNRPVSVTIGEYGGNGCVGYRKEPTKFDFIARSNENVNGSSPTNSLPSSSPTNGFGVNKDDNNVSHMLRSELEMTLSRSNLKKRNEFDRNGVVNEHYQNGGNNAYSTQNGYSQKQNNGFMPQNGKSILQKTQSSNIEKLTNMLQNKQNVFEQNNNDRSATLSNSNRVTINIPNNNHNNNNINKSNGKIELRKTESTPTNGILKNGLNRSSYGDKSISFGN